MQTLNLQLQCIHTERELLAWLIERLDVAGPFVPVSAELDRRCDEFIKMLVENSEFVFVPITEAALARASAAFEQETPATRSMALLIFLGKIGSLMEPTAGWEYCRGNTIVFAAEAWDEGYKFVEFRPCDKCGVVAQHKFATMFEFNVIIDVAMDVGSYVEKFRLPAANK